MIEKRVLYKEKFDDRLMPYKEGILLGFVDSKEGIQAIIQLDSGFVIKTSMFWIQVIK